MESLCFVIAEHNKFGYTCLPYIVDNSDIPHYKIVRPATPDITEINQVELTAEEKEAIHILNKITDKELCKRYSKGKAVHEFIASIDPQIVENIIRQYIEAQIDKALSLIVANDMLIFLRQGHDELTESNILKIEHRVTRPKFYFTLDQTNTLRYSLSISINNGAEIIDVQLTKLKVVELVGNPATLIVKNTLFRLSNIEAKKFRPFYSQRLIIVEPKNVELYLKTFVQKCIANHYVVAKGFGIKKRENRCQAMLSIEQNIFGYFFALNFMYGKESYPFASKDKNVELFKDENNHYTFYTSIRHFAEEKNYSEILCDLGLRIHQNNLFTLTDQTNDNVEQLVEWANNNSQQLTNAHISVDISTPTEKYYFGKIDLQITTDNKIDWFEIYATIVFDGFSIPFIKLKNNILKHDNKYILPNGQIFIIPEEWFARWTDLMHFVRVKNDIIVVDSMHATLIPSDYLEQDIIDSNGQMTISQTPMQGQFEATLRPYQLNGFKWLNTLYENNKGGILADDMGLGKTLQTLALLSHIYATAPIRPDATADNSYNITTLQPSLIVMPVSLIHNWNNEIKKFTQHLKVYNYTGKNRVQSTQIDKIIRHYHIVITTYGLLRNDINYLSAAHFEYLILDESQYIKNPSSITYKAACNINAKHFLTISGTPIENNLFDLWAQMNLINKGLLGSATFFRNFFALPIEKNNKEAEQKLKRLINPYILRRTKSNVANDLPPISEQTIYCTMTQEQAQIYEEEKLCCRNEIIMLNDAPMKTETFVALKALTRLRLVANHPLFINPDYDGLSGKAEQVKEQINNILAEGHNMLIFSSFVRDLEMLRKYLENENIAYCLLTGATRNRQEVIDKFQNNNSIHIFLISLKAGGVGLNLTKADYVIMLNPWWNPQAEQQAIDRAHRIGQDKAVMVYRFITKDTIEEKIEKLQHKKSQLAGTFINNNNPLASLTSEELKALITE